MSGLFIVTGWAAGNERKAVRGRKDGSYHLLKDPECRQLRHIILLCGSCQQLHKRQRETIKDGIVQEKGR